jgi:TolB-like protein
MRPNRRGDFTRQSGVALIGLAIFPQDEAVNLRKFFAELKRRNVYRAAVAYGVVAWFLTQLTTQVFPFFDIPNESIRFVVIVLALGFPIAMALAWIYELTPEGIVRAEDVDPAEARSVRRGTGRILDFIIIGVLLLVIGMLVYQRSRSDATEPIPKKSIAVLPFENRSEDKANSYFADGVQDEIMANLGKIADLKVISRTSTVAYRNPAGRDVREIGRRLGVSHLLEGSVQRLGGTVRVNAQLIDARTSENIWAQTYDRDNDDVFAMQSEIARTIAEQLKAKISAGEQAAIERPPTTDFAAYDLYLQGKEVLSNLSFDAQVNDALRRAITLLEQAVARDPNFVLAYCQLAFAHDHLYFYGLDRNATRLIAAEAAVKAALRIQPDSGEAHLAAAGFRYRCYLDYEGARAELTQARRSLPNEPKILSLSAYIDRRQGRWDQSTRDLNLALELDPQNLLMLQQLALTYQLQRHFSEMAAVLDRALESAPRDVQTRVTRALVSLEQQGDPRPLRETINAVLVVNPAEAKGLVDQWIFLALCERDFAAAARAIAFIEQTGITSEGITFPRAWCEGLRARAQGDAAAAGAAFRAARTEMERKLRADPDYAPSLSVLGLIDAALGRKSEAIAAGKRAVELLPLTKDAIKGAQMIEFLAVIYAWTGENDLAFEQLRAAARVPGYLSYGRLQLHPFWDGLRADPRFAPLVASFARADVSP